MTKKQKCRDEMEKRLIRVLKRTMSLNEAVREAKARAERQFP